MNLLKKWTTAAALATGLVIGSADANKADASIILNLGGEVSNPAPNSIFSVGDIFNAQKNVDDNTPDSEPFPGFGNYQNALQNFEITVGNITFQGSNGDVFVSASGDSVSFRIDPEDVQSIMGFPNGESFRTLQIIYDNVGLANDSLMGGLMAVVNNPGAGEFSFGLNPAGAGASGVSETASISSIPEPSSFALVALGGMTAAGLAGRRRELTPSNE